MAVFHHVEGIKRFVEFTLLAVLEDGGMDGVEVRGEGLRGDEVCNDVGPKAGEGFVITGVFGILAADGHVVERNAFAHLAERFRRTNCGGVKSAGGDVGGVGPLLFG